MGEESARPDSRALLEAAKAAGESASGWWLELTMAAQAALTPYALDLLTIQSITKVKEALGADAISLLVANEAEDELVARVAVGLNQEISVGISIRRGEGMAGQVLASRRPLIVGDLSGWNLASPTLRESGMVSVVAVPISHDQSVLGVLHAGSRARDRFDVADAELLGLVAERLAPAIARVRLLQAERDARRGAEDRARRLDRLEDLTATLAQTKTVNEVADLLQGLVGQLELTDAALWSTVWLRHGDRLVRASGACADDVETVDLDRPLVLCEAVRTGRTVFARSASELEARLPGHHRLRAKEESLAILPIVVESECLGALRVTSPEVDAFGAGERELLQLVVHRAAQAAGRARTHEEREGMARISGFLADASRVTAEAPDFATALNRLADLALRALGEICLIDILGEDGRVERIVARHREARLQPIVDRLHREFPPALTGAHPAVEVIRSGHGAWSETMTDEFLRATTRGDVHYGLVKQLGFRSYLAVPLTSQDVSGAVTFVSTSRAFGHEDVLFAQELARQVAAVIGNVRRYETTLRTSHTLQHALLPPSIPDVPGTVVHSRYLAATNGIDVGGDFYDVMRRNDQGADFVIGDVAGHDREAAALMGQIRSAVRALGVVSSGPAEMMATLSQHWTELGFDRMATLLVVRYFASEQRITVVSAGHYPPLLVDGPSASYLAVPPNPPLAAPTGSIAQWSGPVCPGQLLLLYTDGVIDERGVGVDASMARLAAVAVDGDADPTAVCDRVIDMVGNDRIDDVALLAIRFS